jgi:hypothetical protein
MVAHVAGNLTYGLKACRVAASAVVVGAFSVFVLQVKIRILLFIVNHALDMEGFSV